MREWPHPARVATSGATYPRSVPELPEVEALTRSLDQHAVGRRIASIEFASLSALKTALPPIDSLIGTHVLEARRFGKWLGLRTDAGWLCWHLSRAGWVRWMDELPETPVRPGKEPLALRVGLVTDDGEPAGGFDLTEAGTQKRLAVHVVADPSEIDAIARLGPEPLELDLAALSEILDRAGRSQLKSVLRDQSVIAGIGNAYSDEILHAARLSPFHPAATLTTDERQRLLEAIRTTLAGAVDSLVGLGTGALKSEKKAGLAVHGRAGEACRACGDTVRSVSFADRSLEYCPTCQTGGKPLADRRMSRLLK